MKLHTQPFILLLFAFLGFQKMQAQPLSSYTPEIMLKVANEKLAENDYYNALEWFQKTYKEKKDRSVAHQIAQLQYLLRDFAAAESWYKRVAERDKANEYPMARLYYAKCLKYNGKYDQAADEYAKFIADTKDTTAKKLATIELDGAKMANALKGTPGFALANAGKGINSSFTEGSPIAVGNELYFSAIRGNKVIVLDGKEGDYFSKIYSSQLTPEGKWSEAKPLGANINRAGYHSGNVTFSKDGNIMYFTRVLLRGNTIAESKLYYSTRAATGWQPAEECKGINGDFIVKHPTIGAIFGKPAMFFVSNMPGTLGVSDIFYANMIDDTHFDRPVNLGKDINTLGEEQTPYFVDGTLFFSSDGWVGLGGLDIFKSTWNGSNWSAPQNLGKGYNTSVDDFYFTTSADGKQSFLVSNRPGGNSVKSKTCCDDIYAVRIEDLKFDLSALTFANKKNLNGATVTLYEVVGTTQGKSAKQINDEGHEFDFPLEKEKFYMVIGEKSGYKSDTLTFNTVGLEKSAIIEQKLTLLELPKAKPTDPSVPAKPRTETVEETVTLNQAIRLNNIYYDYDDDKVLLEAEKDLNMILDLMNQYPDMTIELSSHTDSRGKDDYNKKLSQRRADSAKRWLLSKGVSVTRVKAVGQGEKLILNKCTNGVECTEEEHRFNRRTEFKILSGPTSIKITKKVEIQPEIAPTPKKDTTTNKKSDSKSKKDKPLSDDDEDN
jgi:peptidoglycan-associated lipoprotein